MVNKQKIHIQNDQKPHMVLILSRGNLTPWNGIEGKTIHNQASQKGWDIPGHASLSNLDKKFDREDRQKD